uniref:Reverse transcriptase Ty1/copia-type domain-containing protein n=1 Tax=Solanum lycopersicum TaxID=4081 RepID=A0A3Q7J705_SOLLC
MKFQEEEERKGAEAEERQKNKHINQWRIDDEEVVLESLDPSVYLFQHFQIKDLDRQKYFLGIEVAQSRSDILEETGMMGCKHIDTPMDPNSHLVILKGYRRLVGKSNYLTVTRPDISFPLIVVSQFMTSPCDSHWDAVIRILRYIKSAPGKGLLFEDQVGGNLVSWKTNKQSVVARSSAEAEYPAMVVATSELVRIKQLLGELKFGET